MFMVSMSIETSISMVVNEAVTKSRYPLLQPFLENKDVRPFILFNTNQPIINYQESGVAVAWVPWLFCAENFSGATNAPYEVAWALKLGWKFTKLILLSWKDLAGKQYTWHLVKIINKYY